MERARGCIGALWGSKVFSCGCCKGRESQGGFKGRINKLEEKLSRKGSRIGKPMLEKVLEMTDRGGTMGH